MEVVVHNAFTVTQSILKSSIVKEKNMLFPNKEDPFGDLPETIETLADIDTGEAFCNGFLKVKKHHPNAIPVGILVYMDKLVLDNASHLSLEPVYFTLLLFNRKTGNQPNTWGPLGYILSIQLQS
jgi:hypothetical protein